jgi:hypothetical protein
MDTSYGMDWRIENNTAASYMPLLLHSCKSDSYNSLSLKLTSIAYILANVLKTLWRKLHVWEKSKRLSLRMYGFVALALWSSDKMPRMTALLYQNRFNPKTLSASWYGWERTKTLCLLRRLSTRLPPSRFSAKREGAGYVQKI